MTFNLVKSYLLIALNCHNEIHKKDSFFFQFWLVMHYLSTMTEEQTLAMYSGHPMGLFPSSPSAPRVIITNGMVGY